MRDTIGVALGRILGKNDLHRFTKILAVRVAAQLFIPSSGEIEFLGCD